jgi:hypothetical protein
MAERKRMGGMKLGQFDGVNKQAAPEGDLKPSPLLENPDTGLETVSKAPKAQTRRRSKEALSTLNIKVPRSQQRWLQDTAQQVRDNNTEAVPPDQRVYPQHLIQAAIALLQAQDLDWQAIHNMDELKKTLNL